MLNFFVTSFLSSLFESFLLCLVGGTTFSSIWYMVLSFGYEPETISYFILFFGISVPLIWIALFWVKVLFIPSSRGKISIFSPFLTKYFQISFKNETLIPIVSGTWLTIWLFIVTLGWCMAVRSNPIAYKTKHQITSFPPCCQSPGTNFSNWFIETYVPSIAQKQKLPLSERKFLVFQPSITTTFESIINGLFSVFALAIVSDRELLVDWSLDMHNLLRPPYWEWTYGKLFPSASMIHPILDFVTSPSYIVPPPHKWKYSDLLQENITIKLLKNDHIIFVDNDEFFAPFLWMNPYYRNKLCGLCDITQIFKEFSDVLLRFSDNIETLAQKVKEELNLTGTSETSNSDFVIGIADSTVGPKQRMTELKDTLTRCLDAIYPTADTWIIWKKGGGFGEFPKWDQIGNHKIFTIDDIQSLKKSDLLEKTAVLHKLAMTDAKGIAGFAGSSLLESLAYSSGLNLYQVLHKFPVCAETVIRVPCMKKWKKILNSPGIDLQKFMTAEMMNQMKCNI